MPAEAVATPAPAPAGNELAAAERRLASCIGPLARLPVRRAARDASDRQGFYARLGARIANGVPRDRGRLTKAADPPVLD